MGSDPMDAIQVSTFPPMDSPTQWRTERGGGGWGCLNPPPPRNSEGPPKSCQTQPDCENLKFRKPTLQDVRKKDSKILKLLKFATVLH